MAVYNYYENSMSINGNPTFMLTGTEINEYNRTVDKLNKGIEQMDKILAKNYDGVDKYMFSGFTDLLDEQKKNLEYLQMLKQRGTARVIKKDVMTNNTLTAVENDEIER